MAATNTAMSYSLAEINDMDRDRFIAVLGPLFEHTPEIAASVWPQCPFATVNELHEAMVVAVRSLSVDRQLALIRSHPDLGSKARMAPASEREQAGAGLDLLSPAEFERFEQLNRAYKDTFGFPFIIAVKRHAKSSILSAFEERLQHSASVERNEALTQICDIARLRLAGITRPV